MKGYIDTLEHFLETETADIVIYLRNLFPNAEMGQIRSWKVLVEDVKNAIGRSRICHKAVIAIEYMLPIDGMAIDFILAGIDSKGNSHLFIIESKQWSDSYINLAKFTTYRREGFELHPEIQVLRHQMSVRDYLDIGNKYNIKSYVFIRNASQEGLRNLHNRHPSAGSVRIKTVNQLSTIISEISEIIEEGDETIIKDLSVAQFCPCKGIIDAMKSIVTKEEPFLLTNEQSEAVGRIRGALQTGKKIVRITGAAGAGKTAILLNLFLTSLKRRDKTGIIPIFVSGRQNTALYRSLYPEIANMFTLPWTLEHTVTEKDAKNYMLFMDEAQHNDEGVVTQMVERGARLILCYDENQTISANNPIQELKELEIRGDFETINLSEAIRYNGSAVAEANIAACLSGKRHFPCDDKFEFKVFTEYDHFQREVLLLIKQHPEAVVAVVSMLKSLPASQKQCMFTNWESRTECEWIPYVRARDYLNKFSGKLWVGSWWMPGLDVDYIAVIVGEDAIWTSHGLVANIDKVKMFSMIVSVARKLNFGDKLLVRTMNGRRENINFYASFKNIVSFLQQPQQRTLREEFVVECTKYVKNNYYIMMTRGKKGCYVYFSCLGE